MLFILAINASSHYPTFGFTGGLPGSKINNAVINPLLNNVRNGYNNVLPPVNTSFEQLDPGFIANKVFHNDNMISRENFLITPTPDPIREKILAKSDHNESMTFDFTQGFIPALNDSGLMYSSDFLAKSHLAPMYKQSYSQPKEAQALVMDPSDPTNNIIVDLPPGSDYYPANNPYVIVKTSGPIKLKKQNITNENREDSDSNTN